MNTINLMDAAYMLVIDMYKLDEIMTLLNGGCPNEEEARDRHNAVLSILSDEINIGVQHAKEAKSVLRNTKANPT